MAGSVNMMMAGMGDQKRRNEAAAAGSHHHLYIAAGHGGTGTPSGSSCGVVASTKRAKTGGGAAGTVTPVSSSSTARPSPSLSSSSAREKKDKIGERVAALQQLVSPYGKTDTASVLQDATCYIKFLHDQVQKMSAPFLHAPPIHPSQGYSLRSRGLCLVPVECTATIASTNGADIWAPTNTTTTTTISSSSSDGAAYGSADYGYRF